jgi:ABC-type oligopeptide transport system ATPase subunit
VDGTSKDLAVMDEDFLDKVKERLETFLERNVESQDSDDAEQELLKRLLDLEEIAEESDENQPRKPKRARLSFSEEEEHHHSESRTLKDIAVLILEKCSDNQLEDLCVDCRDSSGVTHTLRGNNLDRKSFCDTLDQNDVILVTFNGRNYKPCNKNLNEAFIKVKALFSPIDNLKEKLKELLESNTGDDKSKGIMPWDGTFVHKKGGAVIETIQFPASLEKGSAIVITGESGCGKSWFAKKTIPSMHPCASFLYYELDSGDIPTDIFQPENKELGRLYQQSMKVLQANGGANAKVYDAISELSWRNNAKRNKAARAIFDKVIGKAVTRNGIVEAWWTNATHRLDKLGIIIDEVGKSPDLARGLVDEVRHILCEIHNKGLAIEVMLVLVGSGLDGFIVNDSPNMLMNCKTAELFSSFGTDPYKSEVHVLMGPDPNREVIGGIPRKDINGGTYSKVLATNTRMLTHGVVPVLTSHHNMLRIGDLDKSMRRVELGSTNVVMDYAARVYMNLNGLANLSPGSCEEILSKQFQLLMSGRVHQPQLEKSLSVLPNPAFGTISKPSENDYEEVLKFGLITAKITDTSAALQYLACKGQTAPLYAQDGLAFEVVLQHHLFRRYQADGGQNTTTNCFCGRYNLFQAWPPPSSTQKLSNPQEVEEEVTKRYQKEQEKNRAQNDIAEIAVLLQGKKEYVLVMRQTVSNAQGADVLVLSKRFNKSEATLDLYQAKHYNNLPSCMSDAVVGAFASLGVAYDKDKKSFDVQPKSGSACYSSMGTNMFTDELSRALSLKLNVRRRVVVFSNEWNAFLNSNWKQSFDFVAAESKENIWIWPREMLEPTISALVPVTACNILSGE